MKTLGLALGGGGMKGMAHIGVLQILRDKNINPQYISGTSIGSIIAALYACGISPYRMEEIVAGLSPKDYLDYNIMGTLKYLVSLVWPGYQATLDGIVLGNKVEKLVYDLTGGKKLMEVSFPLAIISCDIDNGKKVIFTNQNIDYEQDDTIIIQDALISEAVRASISIPVTFRPKNYQGIQMVDGGVRDIVPASINKIMGADYVLAVNLGQEIYDVKVKGIFEIISRTLSILMYETSEMEEHVFADMIVFPGIKNAGLDDISEYEKIIRAGRRAMKEKLEQLEQELGF